MTGLQSLVKGLIKGFERVYKVLLYSQIQNKGTSQRIEGMTKIPSGQSLDLFTRQKKEKKKKKKLEVRPGGKTSQKEMLSSPECTWHY